MSSTGSNLRVAAQREQEGAVISPSQAALMVVEHNTVFVDGQCMDHFLVDWNQKCMVTCNSLQVEAPLGGESLRGVKPSQRNSQSLWLLRGR